MASQSEKEVIGVLVLAECTVQSFSANASPSLAGICGRLQDRINRCFKQWEVLEQKHVKALHQRIDLFDQKTFAGRRHASPIYTSMLLLMIEDIYRQVKGTRKAVIHDLLTSLKALHRYYDRKLNRIDNYRTAAHYAAQWGI